MSIGKRLQNQSLQRTKAPMGMADHTKLTARPHCLTELDSSPCGRDPRLASSKAAARNTCSRHRDLGILMSRTSTKRHCSVRSLAARIPHPSRTTPTLNGTSKPNTKTRSRLNVKYHAALAKSNNGLARTSLNYTTESTIQISSASFALRTLVMSVGLMHHQSFGNILSPTIPMVKGCSTALLFWVDYSVTGGLRGTELNHDPTASYLWNLVLLPVQRRPISSVHYIS